MELPKPGESYINPNVIARRRALGKVSLLAFVGPTASGKTTIMNEIELRHSNEFKRVVGFTNRPMRLGEADGQDYYFLDNSKMQQMHEQAEFLQLETTPAGDTYGTRLDSYTPKKINMFAVLAQAMPNFREYGFVEVKPVFIVPHSHNFWLELLGSQDIPKHKIAGRKIEAIQSYKFALSDEQTKFILNDYIADAVERVLQASHDESVWNEKQARLIAIDNLEKLTK